MATYTIYVLQANDFVGGLPDEVGSPGIAAGGATHTLTVGAGATWVEVTVTDDDLDFGEEITNGGGGDATGPTQSLTFDVTLNGVTYFAGDTIVTAYDLANSGTGLQITAFHIGSGIDGFEVGPVVGIVSSAPMPPGTYFFDTNVSSYNEPNPYSEWICFARGTAIGVRDGVCSIENLNVGDLVETMDHGLQAISWIGSTKVPAVGNAAPVVFSKGALGNNRELRVSPQHRMLLSGWKAELLFGEPKVLSAAIHLVNGDTIYRDEGGTVEYFHIMFDNHEIIFAEGAPSESFHPGEQGFGNMAEDAREEIFGLFPELRKDLSNYGPTAHQSLKRFEAKVFSA